MIAFLLVLLALPSLLATVAEECRGADCETNDWGLPVDLLERPLQTAEVLMDDGASSLIDTGMDAVRHIAEHSYDENQPVVGATPRPPKEDCPLANKKRGRSGGKTDNILRLFHWNVEWLFSPLSRRAKWQTLPEQQLARVMQCPEDWSPDVTECVTRPLSEALGGVANGERPETKFMPSCKSAASLEFVEGDAHDGCMRQWKRINDVSRWLNYFYTQLGFDLVTFSELDGCRSLSDVLAYSGLDQIGFDPFHIQGGDFRSNQQVGFASRIRPTKDLVTKLDGIKPGGFPVTQNPMCQKYKGVERGKDYDYSKIPEGIALNKYARMDINVNGQMISVINIHLKSIPSHSNSCMYREVEARILDEIIEKEIPDHHEIILVGDFNDFDDQAEETRDARHIHDPKGTAHPLQIPTSGFNATSPTVKVGYNPEDYFELDERSGELEISEDLQKDWAASWVFQIIRYGANGKRKGTNKQMWSLTPKIPQQERYTYIWRQRRSQLDHMLVSRNLYHAVTRFEILNDEAAKKGLPYIHANFGKDHHNQENPSDHYPLFAEFDIGKIGATAQRPFSASTAASWEEPMDID
ncbi:unnamed protein product [Vitrella brassicaformis CCMP3155]|uniref:Endonuclease/exonuclease/phosphatase domain-containing protein n=2 Tax=Vitrella brassicaformis TaxID=1169539 RepID=A0A0G4FPM5_VITBC|nr:unnamed protein product [Vitrella brassicaformis CCMP3155]|eukprot:CEM15964.1 unnamed protein product [Vitrella brassicaformis CCMP3155]